MVRRVYRGATPMPAALRLTIWTVFAVLWVSGCIWLVLHFAFETRTEFGPLPNPWEASVLEIHGVLAVAAVFLIGWISSSHILERWSARRNRKSGLTLATTAAVLVVSGYMLYYTTDRLHSMAAVAHEIIGVLAAFVAITHWRLRSLPGREH
jgi:hypothetical protein